MVAKYIFMQFSKSIDQLRNGGHRDVGFWPLAEVHIAEIPMKRMAALCREAELDYLQYPMTANGHYRTFTR